MHVSHGLQPYGPERGEGARPRTILAQSTAEVRPITANSIALPYRRDVPATPSHMQIRIDDLPSALNLRESSFTGDNHANRTSSGRISLHKSYEFGPTASRISSVPGRSLSRSYNFETSGFEDNSTSSMTPGFYPAVLDRDSEPLCNRQMPSNPVPIKTLGQFGFGMFDLHTPIGIAAAHDGNTVLVSDQSKSRILIYDLDSGMMMGFIKYEGEIKDLTISTMGHVLVVTNKTEHRTQTLLISSLDLECLIFTHQLVSLLLTMVILFLSRTKVNQEYLFMILTREMMGFIKCEGEIKDLTISTMGHVLVATNKTGINLANAYTLDGHKIASLGM